MTRAVFGLALAALMGAPALADGHGTPMRNFPGFLITGRSVDGSFANEDVVFPQVVVCDLISRGVRKDPGLTFPKVADLWQGDVAVVDPREQIGNWVRVVGQVDLVDAQGNVIPDPTVERLEGWVLSEVLCDFVQD